MIRKIKNFFQYLLEATEVGFYEISSILSRGFFFYFYMFFSLLEKIFKWDGFTRGKEYFRIRQKDPTSFLTLVLIFVVGIFLHTYLYVDQNDIRYVDDGILDIVQTRNIGDNTSIDNSTTLDMKETNLYRRYGKLNINNIDISELKKDSKDVVAWLMVDGTNVNYPIVQTDNNDYYLNHDLMGRLKASGWTYMDYRNQNDMSDMNTIFYGHNLLNKTGFGSLSNVFTKEWFEDSNHLIVVKTEERKYFYQVFSVYTIEPELYYLQTNFYRDIDYQEFLDTLVERSIYDFEIELDTDAKIITLSTCTDDSRGRKVVHARLVG